MENLYEFEEEFRDSIATVDEKGKRIWVYPKKPKGKFTNARTLVAIVLLGLLFSGPFIKIGGQPLLLFNIFERKFVIFGVAFWPQDFYLFGLATITLFVFIILFTVVFGRVWCGWACPQTIFMETVFRRIEYWLEGDASQQRKLAKAPWTSDKIFKKGLKHLIFMLISVVIAHTLMAYLVGIEQVKEIVTSSPYEHWGGFIATVFFTIIFYWVFSSFREQACIAVCPYGRLQGVLLNNDSMGVAYDFVRGEPRGRLHQGEIADGQGDCIDCKLCVHACPTGIDIRHGTQLECINCTACMDACDEVMLKVDKPQGLIRISSYNSIVEEKKSIFTTRVLAYIVVLSALLVTVTSLMLNRTDIDATVLRVPGLLYQKTEDGRIQNLFNVLFVNKTFEPASVDIRLRDNPEAEIIIVGGAKIDLKANSTKELVLFVNLPPEKLAGAKTPIVFEIVRDGEIIDTASTNFLGPFSF
jgi:cytochrome c oxidase accessory protein FixG